MSALTQITPVLYLVYSSKLRGLAINAISKSFDLDIDNSKSLINNLIIDNEELTSEIVNKLTKAEEYIKAELKELKINPNSLREKKSSDIHLHLIGTLILILTFVLEFSVIFIGYEADTIPGEVVGRILGTFDAATMMYLAYIYGTSAGSARKTELMSGN